MDCLMIRDVGGPFYSGREPFSCPETAAPVKGPEQHKLTEAAAPLKREPAQGGTEH